MWAWLSESRRFCATVPFGGRAPQIARPTERSAYGTDGLAALPTTTCTVLIPVCGVDHDPSRSAQSGCLHPISEVLNELVGYVVTPPRHMWRAGGLHSGFAQQLGGRML